MLRFWLHIGTEAVTRETKRRHSGSTHKVGLLWLLNKPTKWVYCGLVNNYKQFSTTGDPLKEVGEGFCFDRVFVLFSLKRALPFKSILCSVPLM